MGTTRRQHNQKEATFLESVKTQLNVLLQDIGDIKTSIEAIKFANGASSAGLGANWGGLANCASDVGLGANWGGHFGNQDDGQSWAAWGLWSYNEPWASNLTAGLPDTPGQFPPQAQREPYCNVGSKIYSRGELRRFGQSLKKESPPLEVVGWETVPLGCVTYTKTAEHLMWSPGDKRFVKEGTSTALELQIEAARMIQRRFYKIKGKCAKCKAAQENCVCFMLLCQSCLKSAERCQCLVPMFHLLECLRCGATCAQQSSEGNVISTAKQFHFQCQNGCGDLVEKHDWNWLMESDHACGTCWKYDRQQSLRWCDGQDCKSDYMHHRACMARAQWPEARNELREPAWLCVKCFASGVQPFYETSAASNTGSESEALEHNTGQAAHHEQPDSGTSGNVGKGMRELDNLLEYIVRFLEGEHMKSASISQASRDTILARVKAALEWRRQDRTTEEAAAMVEDLNNMMFRIL